jgi:hypothetical protein
MFLEELMENSTRSNKKSARSLIKKFIKDLAVFKLNLLDYYFPI